MSNIRETIVNHIKTYDEMYDDHEKYFDYLYDFHTNIHQFIEERVLFVLDKDKFSDFYDFCIERMNKFVVSQQIKSEKINEFYAEYKLSENVETLQVDQSSIGETDQSSVGEDDNYEEENEIIEQD